MWWWGTCICKKNLNATQVRIDETTETIGFTITVNRVKIAILSSYRPPYSVNEDSYFDSIKKLLKHYEDLEIEETFIVGDLNFNMLDTNSSKKLIEFNANQGFFNSVTKSTRINSSTNAKNPNSETLLDVILGFCNAKLISSDVFNYPNSDHKLVISIFDYHSERIKHCKVQSRCLNDKKIELIKQKMHDYFKILDLKLILDVNVRWSLIKEGIIKCVDEIAPLKSMNIRSTKILPWFDKDMVKLSHKRNTLYNKWYKSKSSIDRENFIHLRNRFNSTLRFKKATYYKNYILNNSISTKSFWDKLNPFLNPNKKQKISAAFLSSKKVNINSSQELVDTFSNFFSSILNNFKFINIKDCKLYLNSLFDSNQILASYSNYYFIQIIYSIKI